MTEENPIVAEAAPKKRGAPKSVLGPAARTFELADQRYAKQEARVEKARNALAVHELKLNQIAVDRDEAKAILDKALNS